MVAASMLFPLAGCGDDDTDGGEDPVSNEPGTFTVTGTVHVDVVGGVTIKRNPDRCVATGSLTRGLFKEGADPVVVSDPEGTEVALGRIGRGRAPIVTDDGEQYYVPGVCNFPFIAKDVPQVAGVFTAAIPELDIAARFSKENARAVKLRLDP